MKFTSHVRNGLNLKQIWGNKSVVLEMSLLNFSGIFSFSLSEWFRFCLSVLNLISTFILQAEYFVFLSLVADSDFRLI